MAAMLATAWVLMAVLMLVLWRVHLAIRNAGIVDVGWAGGLALIGLLYVLTGDGWLPRKLLVLGVALLWGGRLSLFLLFTRVLGKPEDGRYRALREEWGEHQGARMFRFFQIQAAVAAALSLPFLLAACNPSPHWSPWEVLGAGVWAVGFVGELTADWQLARFKQNPENRGRICKTGLWRTSRHPNYFFESVVWWGFFLIALGSPWGLVAVVSPLMMLYFLLRVTGVPTTEAHALRTRSAEYRDYQTTTSAFVPWWPKKGRQ